MAVTTIANLWNPAIWMGATREGMATFPNLFASGAVSRNPTLDAIASGAGTAATIPFWKDATDGDDEIQVEGTAPTPDNIAGDTVVAPILNRVKATGSSALAGAVSGGDPMAEIGRILGTRRVKQRQKTVLAMLRGVMGAGATAAAGGGVLAAMRKDHFDESGVSAASTELLDVDKFIDAKSLMGELQDALRGGVIWIHPTPLAGLEKADVTSFKEKSMGAFTIRTYRDIPLVVSESLVRAGTTNGYVYETFLIANGALGVGEKPQAGDSLDVASLQLFLNKEKNEAVIYDRTRWLTAIGGIKWTGTPSGQSATNAELQTIGNWSLKWATANRCGIVCIRTNG
jgi:hypothetical protein